MFLVLFGLSPRVARLRKAVQLLHHISYYTFLRLNLEGGISQQPFRSCLVTLGWDLNRVLSIVCLNQL